MGIDYGMGQTNIDKETGIRYGVIHQNEVLQAWADESEPNYGDPHCPKCGNTAISCDDERVPDLDEADDWDDPKIRDYCCLDCKHTFWSDEAFGDEPIGHSYFTDEYQCTQGGDDGDIFILKSPYYTLCDFCSPCAPGAGYLISEGDVKAYCFGHDWFYDHPEHPKVAPYRVFRVSDDSEVLPE